LLSTFKTKGQWRRRAENITEQRIFNDRSYPNDGIISRTTHASPYSLSVHYLIRQKRVWPIVNP